MFKAPSVDWLQCTVTTVFSTSLGKKIFVWRFILNENILFWLTISYQKIFVFSVSVFCSRIFTIKLNLRIKRNFYSKVNFFFLSKKIFFIFLCWILIIDVCHNNIVKNSEKMNKRNFRKYASKLPTLQISYNLQSFLLWEKEEYLIFEKTMTIIKLLVHW